MTFNRNPWFLIIPTLFILLSSCSETGTVKRKLRKLNLSWELDADGDYRIAFPLSEDGEITVGVGAHTLGLNSDVRVRELWAVAARIPGEFPGDLAENLLSDSWSTRKYGSWAVAGTTTDGRTVLVYLARIPDDASLRLFSAVLYDVAQSAADMGEALSDLEASP